MAGAGFRGFLNRNDWYVSLIISFFGAIGVLIWATNDSLRTLYPIGLDGAADSTKQSSVADWGISIYVAGFGVLLGLVGSLTLRQATSVGSAKKKCPDCAEAVLADARVCKHCGYHFAIRPTMRRNAAGCGASSANTFKTFGQTQSSFRARNVAPK